MNVMKVANLTSTSMVTKLVNVASTYAPAMEKAASMMPQGRVTVGLNLLKTLNTKKFPGLAELIKATELIGAKNPTITLASKAAKIHTGGLMTGIVLKDGKNVIAGGAALINPQAGKAASVNLRLRAPGASIHSIFNPNEFTRDAVHNGVVDSLISTRTSNGIEYGNFRLFGKAVSATTELNYDKFMQALLKSPKAKELKPLFEATKSGPADIMEFLRTLFTKGEVTEMPFISKVEKAIEGILSSKQLAAGNQEAKSRTILSKLNELFGPDKASKMYGKLSSKDPDGVLAAISKHQEKLKW